MISFPTVLREVDCVVQFNPPSSDRFGMIQVGNTPCGAALADSPCSGWSQEEQRWLYIGEGARARRGP